MVVARIFGMWHSEFVEGVVGECVLSGIRDEGSAARCKDDVVGSTLRCCTSRSDAGHERSEGVDAIIAVEGEYCAVHEYDGYENVEGSKREFVDFSCASFFTSSFSISIGGTTIRGLQGTTRVSLYIRALFVSEIGATSVAVVLFILVVVVMICDTCGGVLSMETPQDVVDVVTSLRDDGDVVMAVSSEVLEGGVVNCCIMDVWPGWITVVGRNPQ